MTGDITSTTFIASCFGHLFFFMPDNIPLPYNNAYTFMDLIFSLLPAFDQRNTRTYLLTDTRTSNSSFIYQIFLAAIHHDNVTLYTFTSFFTVLLSFDSSRLFWMTSHFILMLLFPPFLTNICVASSLIWLF